MNPLVNPATQHDAVIILNWNRVARTMACLQALFAEEDALNNIMVIVVDNGSSDGSVEAIATAYPQVQLVENDTNLGFARGNNTGLRHALALGSRHAALLNNDALLGGRALRTAFRDATNDSSIGLLGGRIVSGDGKIWYAGGHLDLRRGSVVMRGQGRPDGPQYREREEVGFITLAFAVLSQRALREVGLLEEDYFFGQEEWDYSLRVRRAGLRLVYEPSIVCLHGGDGSHDNSAPAYIYNGFRNKIRFQRSHLSAPAFLLWLVVFALYAVLYMPFSVRHLHRNHINASTLRWCALLALRDYFKLGPRVEEAHLKQVAARFSMPS